VNYAKLDQGSVQWPCNDKAPEGTPIMHIDGFVRGKGLMVVTEYVATDEKVGPRFPLLLTTGRILSQYNVGAQTRRTANVVWHPRTLLEIHPQDAEDRGIRDGDWVRLASRTGETSLRARVTDRVAPGVIYTTFHHPGHAGERRHHGIFRLGDELPGIQGDGGADLAVQWAQRMAGHT
jgi:formate dehydrogenase major subunit